MVNLGKIGHKTPESSISRGLSNLHRQEKILKLEKMKMGEFDKPNHLWQVVHEPLQVGIQTVLF